MIGIVDIVVKVSDCHVIVGGQVNRSVSRTKSATPTRVLMEAHLGYENERRCAMCIGQSESESQCSLSLSLRLSLGLRTHSVSESESESDPS